MDNVYGLGFPVRSFAVANGFAVATNKACYKLGQQLTPFCIYADKTQKEYGVVDFAGFSGFVNPGVGLVSEVAAYRRQLYLNCGVNPCGNDRLLFYDYLLSMAVCYVEIPRYVTKSGMALQSYDKFFATRNPALMAAWMGMDVNEMQARYSARIGMQQPDFVDGVIRCVKLNTSAKGNTVTLPRGVFKADEMRCIPLYMLHAFIEGVKPALNDGIVSFSFLKDNGTVRELPTTLNKSILMSYYKDNAFVGTMLSGVDIDTVKQGSMTMGSRMNRGYVKVPEVGASVYDGTGVRSLNLARLLKVEKVDSVDASYIHVDLGSAVQNFKDGLDKLLVRDASQVASVYRGVVGSDPEVDNPAGMVQALCVWVDGRSVVLSTTFHRMLHSFMVMHPEWFTDYTGRPVATVTSSANFGVEAMDF